MSKSRFLSALLSALFAVPAAAQVPVFFDSSAIQEISINFSQSNWDYLLDSIFNVDEENRLVAYSVTINGVVYDSVGVRYKGNSTYQPNNAKNPFNLKLDYVRPGAEYDGMSTIKLSNGFKDPSMIREVLGYEIARAYMPAPHANFARVYVNGQFHGVYTNVESLNGNFRDRYFYSSDNPFFKCDPLLGAAPTPGCPPAQGSAAALTYLGQDTTCYKTRYEIESDSGWYNLMNLTSVLNQNTAAIDDVLDVDRALWMLAFNNLTVNLDSYSGSGHNYYVYQDNNRRFNTVVWDLNEAFGGFTNGGQGQLSIAQMEALAPRHNENNTGRPLLNKLMPNLRWRKSYLAHLRTMLDEQILSGLYQTRGLQLQQLIDQDVYADPNKFFTNAQFNTNLNTTAANIPGIISLMTNRSTFLDGHSDLTAPQPVIGAPAPSVAAPQVGTAFAMTAPVSNATMVKLRHRAHRTERFVESDMFDDGNHQDGAAGDGVYGAGITMPATGVLQYYIYAENAQAARFSPERAEYYFYILTGTFVSLPPSTMTINEFMAGNASAVADEYGEFEDWIELRNNTNANVNLAGLYLSDDRLNLTKFNLPDTIVPPSGHVVVWADEDGLQGPMHANFKLSRTGEEIFLYNADSSPIDSLTFGVQTDNISVGRCPDGTGPFQVMAPYTPGSPNNCQVNGAGEIDATPLTVGVFPVPAAEAATVKLQCPRPVNGFLEVFDLTGRLLMHQRVALPAGEFFLPLDLRDLPQGLYQLRVQDASTIGSCRFAVSRP
jgi:hypothetical protein